MNWNAVGLGIAALIYAMLGAVLGFILTYVAARFGVALVGASASVVNVARWVPLGGAALGAAAAGAGYLRSVRGRS